MRLAGRLALTLAALLSLPCVFHSQTLSVLEPPEWRQPRPHAVRDSSVNGFTAPVLGYVVDAAGAVRAMPGLPGASWLAAPLPLGFSFAAGAVSPRQDYVLGLVAPDRAALLIPLVGSQRAASSLAGVDPGADHVVLSPSGTAAAFYFNQGPKLELVSGLPGAPAAAGSLDLSSFAGLPSAMAVSDDGSLVLISAATADGAAIYALSSQSAPRLLLNGGDFAAPAFLRNSFDALVADRQRNSLYRIRDVSGPGEVVLLAAGSDGVSAPVAVAASADASRFVVANSGPATIGYLNAAGGPLTLLSCSCTPAALASLSGNAVFRLTEVSNGPLWAFDGDSPEPRLVLVPQPLERRTVR